MLVMPLLGLLYVAVLIRNLQESERRSLQLREVRVGDYVSVGMKVVEVDVSRSEVRVQLQLRPLGNLALDGVTPTRNLKLFLNASRGSQEIDFPSGERMNPVEADFFLDGDTNRQGRFALTAIVALIPKCSCGCLVVMLQLNA